MKAYLQGIIFGLYSISGFAQKPLIDSTTFDSWEFVGGAQISSNGNYALYTVEDPQFSKRTMVVRSTKGNWKFEMPEVSGQFTPDSKYFIFPRRKDTLCIMETGGGIVDYISNVSSFSIPRNADMKLLICQLKNGQNTLMMYNLETRKKKTFDFVKQYILSSDGATLLLITEEKKDSIIQSLRWVKLSTGEVKDIWQGDKAGNFVLNKKNDQLVFTVVRRLNNQTQKIIWYYKNGMDKAIQFVAANQSVENERPLELEGVGAFCQNDSSVFLNFKQNVSSKPLSSPVYIWSYSDVILQSSQQNTVSTSTKTYKAAINLQSAKIVRLDKDNEMLVPPALAGNSINEWMLTSCHPGEPDESGWNVNASVSGFLISVRDGRRIKIPGLGESLATISPLERYVVYFDPKQKNYFSYEIKSGVIRNLTKNIPVSWAGYIKDLPVSENSARGIAAWLANDEGVLIYDERDIWLIDMAGQKSPYNITNAYGKKHHIVFSLELGIYNSKAILKNERLIINAFNQENKDNGYFAKVLSKPGDPELLSMGPYLYNIPDNPYLPSGSIAAAQKALNANMYLVRRMSATEAPNYFSTNDFKTFKPLSDVQPQKKYNWLTAELVTWKALDGRLLQGILYKPENFDSLKKYPMIFNYYEIRSDRLHAFLRPDYSSDDINIPWYTSNGYLVFTPDIHHRIGETAESVISSVVSAAQHMSQMPWVNSKKMGIQGFSFGGFETNVLVTHSNIFAAACSASGISDLISSYGSLLNTGSSMQFMYEFHQQRIGATLWQRPDLYIKNSPIFRADKVTTPLLMMHTTQDGVCHFSNAVEFFTGLRRLGKKVWMLQYEGNHFPAGDSHKDYSTRLAQFFDHYLKDAPAPKWMTNTNNTETGVEVTQK